MSMTAKQVYNALDDVGFVKELADIKERWDNTDKKDFKPFDAEIRNSEFVKKIDCNIVSVTQLPVGLKFRASDFYVHVYIKLDKGFYRIVARTYAIK